MKKMKKLRILIIAILISLSICAFTNLQVKAVTLNLTAVASASPIDAGGSSVLSVSVSGGSGSYTYQWIVEAPGATTFSNITTNGKAATYTFATSSSTTLGNYQFAVYAADVNLPFGTGLSSPVTVTVNSALVAPTISASVGTVDQGQTSSLTSSPVTTGTSPYTYQWYSKVGTGSYAAISGATSTSYNFVTSGSTTTGVWSFELQVNDSAYTHTSVTSTAASVTVNTAPTVTVSPTSWTMDVSQSKTFTATPSGGSGTYTGYQWYVGGSPQAGQIASTFSYSPTSSGSYSITVTVTDSSSVTSAQSSA